MVYAEAVRSDNPPIVKNGNKITATFSVPIKVLEKTDDPSSFTGRSFDSDAATTTAGTAVIEITCP